MKEVSSSRRVNTGEIVKRYNTSNPDEFLEVNCFHCKKGNLKLSPEACLSGIVQLALLSPRERMSTFCSKCMNYLIADYSEVLKKRAEKRGYFIDEFQITIVLKEFLRSNIDLLIEKYRADEREVYLILRNYFNTLL